jgi:hypothetical protein
VSPKFKAKAEKVFSPPPALRGKVGLLVPVMAYRSAGWCKQSGQFLTAFRA